MNFDDNFNVIQINRRKKIRESILKANERLKQSEIEIAKQYHQDLFDEVILPWVGKCG